MKRLLMNTVEGGEVRVALMDGSRLEEIRVERLGHEDETGNVYKGRVTGVDRGLQAAFVAYGVKKDGFLHASDCLPPDGGYKFLLARGGRSSKPSPRTRRMGIQEMLKKGAEILVQVTKKGAGRKGSGLTSYLSIPGKYLVLMPAVARLGVSKKIVNESERRALRKALDGLAPPKDLGFIIRTAGLGKRKKDLKRDLDYLLRLWRTLVQRARKAPAPALIHQESDLIIRALRDLASEDIDEVLIDSKEALDRARKHASSAMPRLTRRMKLYGGPEPVFEKFGVENELTSVLSRKVKLESGGHLVFDRTEAFVAVDVNSGSFRGARDNESMVLKTNLEAAKETARQLRLRDLGGLIMIDFIDTANEEHRRRIERALEDELAKDRARTRAAQMSPFCVVELTRQRARESLMGSYFQSCPRCAGLGYVKADESSALEWLRKVRALLAEKKPAEVHLRVQPEVAILILNRYRGELIDLERTSGSQVSVEPTTEKEGIKATNIGG